MTDDFNAYLTEKYSFSWWLSDDATLIARYQLYEPRLAVLFSVFHEGVEKLLGRPVWTHEFADVKRLQRELERK